MTYQRAQDEPDHEEPAKDGLTVQVAEPHGWHGDEHEVDALPVRQRLRVGEVHERVTRILQLRMNIARSISPTYGDIAWDEFDIAW